MFCGSIKKTAHTFYTHIPIQTFDVFISFLCEESPLLMYSDDSFHIKETVHFNNITIRPV